MYRTLCLQHQVNVNCFVIVLRGNVKFLQFTTPHTYKNLVYFLCQAYKACHQRRPNTVHLLYKKNYSSSTTTLKVCSTMTTRSNCINVYASHPEAVKTVKQTCLISAPVLYSPSRRPILPYPSHRSLTCVTGEYRKFPSLQNCQDFGASYRKISAMKAKGFCEICWLQGHLLSLNSYNATCIFPPQTGCPQVFASQTCR